MSTVAAIAMRAKMTVTFKNWPKTSSMPKRSRTAMIDAAAAIRASATASGVPGRSTIVHFLICQGPANGLEMSGAAQLHRT